MEFEEWYATQKPEESWNKMKMHRTWDHARAGMISVDDVPTQVEDSCGCSGGTCWCIRHAAACLRGESVVDAAPMMLSVEDVCEAADRECRNRLLQYEGEKCCCHKVVAAIRKLAGGSHCNRCGRWVAVGHEIHSCEDRVQTAKNEAVERVAALKPKYGDQPVTSDGDRLAGYMEAIDDAIAAIQGADDA